MEEFGTICALATAAGESAISVVRVSGEDAIEIVEGLFLNPKGERVLLAAKTHTAHYGKIVFEGKIIDECICTIFRAPHSYTGENSVEISLHGSTYIQQQTIQALIKSGAKTATAGEYTKRAFLNGKLDLSQAEAVADIIHSHNSAAHELAFKQLRGGYHQTLSRLRLNLLDIASLLELELDFSEEDVEFADRTHLKNSLNEIKTIVSELVNSFSLGNAFKNGVPVSIIGKPNAGKSTLLNVLLNEERAIVSDIAGTTRDTIEESVNIGGVEFRFIDTAGIRSSEDIIETEGIKRTYKSANNSKIILYLIDIANTTPEGAKKEILELKKNVDLNDKHLIILINKSDIIDVDKETYTYLQDLEPIFISAKKNINIDEVSKKMLSITNPADITNKVLLTNSRHYESMIRVLESIESVENGFIQNLPSDLIAIDIRTALYHIGTITGEVTTDEILGNIFSRFCVGK